MRRLLSVVLVALIAVFALLPATTAFAEGDSALVLAAEEAPAGPSADVDNPNAPADFESPDGFFMKETPWILAGSTLGVVGLMGLLYWLLVLKPERAKEA